MLRRICALACGITLSLIVAHPAAAVPPASDTSGDLLEHVVDCDGYWLTATFRSEVTTTVFFDEAGQPTKQRTSVDYDLRVSVSVGPEPFEGELVAAYQDLGQYSSTFFLAPPLIGRVGVDLRITIPEVGLIVISAGASLFNTESGKVIESGHRTSVGQVDWCSAFMP